MNRVPPPKDGASRFTLYDPATYITGPVVHLNTMCTLYVTATTLNYCPASQLHPPSVPTASRPYCEPHSATPSSSSFFSFLFSAFGAPGSAAIP